VPSKKIDGMSILTKPGPVPYRVPAEWEPHTSTWLAWPHFENDWPGKFEPIQWVYAEIIRNLTRHERVDLIVNDAAAAKRAQRTLKLANASNKNLALHPWPTDRVWTRDSGCTFVAGKAPAPKHSHTKPALCAIKWRFNAWAKYPNYKLDDQIGLLMADAAHAEWTLAAHNGRAVVLEGGSIDVNGRGTLLTTEECLLSKVQQRNRGFKKVDYERVFAACLGIEQVIWLGRGIAGDDTHGHVDDITRFVAPNVIATVTEPNRRDANHAPLRDNLRRLKAATNLRGKKFEVVELPMPKPVTFEGRRLPASYGNFYIANQQVLVPVFNDANDRIALNILSDLFPTREIVPIYSGDLIWGFGALHCMTQQQPAIG
jgi:agmatine deiminase